MIVVAVDPGREKCGLAVAAPGEVLEQAVVDRDSFSAVLKDIVQQYDIDQIIVGDRTGAADFIKEIKANFPNYPLKAVDEHLTSQEARRRYWQEKPPAGWRRFWPIGMQVPPEPYDDFVAVILAERFFNRKC